MSYMLSKVLLGSTLAALGLATDAAVIPVEHGRLANGAAVVIHRQPAVPIVSLRMSILAQDPAGYAGAGHMIQHLLYPGLRDRAARVGGQVQIQRTSDAVVYTVTGPARELPFLSDLLISTLTLPTFTLDAILRADRELREERFAEWETAPAHARSMLRAQLFPADISAAGTDRSATRFTAASLPGVWAQMYGPERVVVVAVGDVFLGDVVRAFGDLPASTEVRPLGIQRDSVVLVPLAPPQATRAWFAQAHLATDQSPAAATVTTRMLGDVVRRRLPSAQVNAEHWWTHHGQAIALVVAVPEQEAAAARRVLGTALESLLDEVNFLRTVDAATAVRRELLFYSRTPDRMAEVIGHFVDRGGDPNATERFYADLDRVDDDDVRAILEALIERTPARVEIPPQALQPRRR
jgi:predicted Zn-dependent peptidase